MLKQWNELKIYKNYLASHSSFPKA